MLQKISKIALYILLLDVSALTSPAQTPADSLTAVLKQQKLTTEQKVHTLSLLARAQSATLNSLAIQNGLQAVQLARPLSDAQHLAIAYAILAPVYLQNDDMPQATQAVDSALFYAAKTENPLARGIAWYRKSWIENQKGKSKEALASASQALQYLEKAGSPYYEAGVYYVMAGIYANEYDGPLHKKYAQLSLHAAQKAGDIDAILCAWQTLGTYWQYNYIEHKDKKALDSALYYNQLALNTYLTQKNKVITHSVGAIVALNTADIYAQFFPASYRDTVFHYLDYAEKIGTETHHTEVVANCYGMKSDYEVAAGNYDNAEALLLKGLSMMPTDSSRNLATKIQFMASLSGLAEKRGRYKDALEYMYRYNHLYTDLYNQEKLNTTKELEARYQAEKNATALATLQQTTRLHKRLGYLYIGLALVSVTAAIFLIRSLRFRLQLAEKAKNDAALTAQLKQQENKQLAMEKQEAELQALLKNEETLRLTAEQELLLERQERLQKDLLAGTLQVEQKTELLQTLQKTIAENKSAASLLTQINRIINHDKRLDESFADSKAELDSVHPGFFETLKERSGNQLSKLDLKHCSYIYLGLSNKEASQRLGIAHKSILMARYRIKLKLGLSKEEELDDYIRSI